MPFGDFEDQDQIIKKCDLEDQDRNLEDQDHVTSST